ncbi:hypothetical protein ABBQ38_002585 [Trebouxia sp. C0009 RCD-2024]
MHTTSRPLARTVITTCPASLRSPRSRAARLSCRPRTAVRAQSTSDAMTLLLDCDGVLVDTEAQGHRVSFNEAFKQKGLEFRWTVEEYGHLLAIGGGKERMAHYFTAHAYQEPFASMPSMEDRVSFVKEMHMLKTDIFMKLIEEGRLPLRPGVKRIINEALEAGAKVAICSTSNEKAVQKIVDVMMEPEVASQIRVFAGDVVPHKKPDPAIYYLAAQELGVKPSSCVVIEDSHIGSLAAKAAGMRCFVTKSEYTEDEDFTKADAVYDCIGDEGDERFSYSDMIKKSLQGATA